VFILQDWTPLDQEQKRIRIPPLVATHRPFFSAALEEPYRVNGCLGIDLAINVVVSV
jgi:hypothetical protein